MNERGEESDYRRGKSNDRVVNLADKIGKSDEKGEKPDDRRGKAR